MALPKTMRALRAEKSASGDFSLGIEEVPVPTPKAGELLLKVQASGVQPSDVLNVRGSFNNTTFPRIPGRDFAGLVVEGPPELKGQQVFGTSGPDFSFTSDGSCAEYTVVPVEAVAKLPSSVSPAQAAVIGTPWAAALIALSRANITSADTIMVLGASGSVGSAAMQIARSKGATALGVGRHNTDINSVTDPTLSKATELTGGKGPTIVLDTVGDYNLLLASFHVLANGGRMCTITSPRTGSTQLSMDVFMFYRRDLTFIGVNTALTSQTVLGGMFRDLLPAFAAGALKPPAESTLTKLTLDTAQEAYSGKARHAVITFP